MSRQTPRIDFVGAYCRITSNRIPASRGFRDRAENYHIETLHLLQRYAVVAVYLDIGVAQRLHHRQGHVDSYQILKSSSSLIFKCYRQIYRTLQCAQLIIHLLQLILVTAVRHYATTCLQPQLVVATHKGANCDGLVQIAIESMNPTQPP